MKTLTPELIEQIKTDIKYSDLYYVDYRDELSTENLQKIIKTGSLYEEDYMDSDYEYDSYFEILKDIKKTFDLSEEFLEEYEDELRDIIYTKCSNDPLPDLIKNSGSQPVRLTAYSNYEGIRSDYDHQCTSSS